MPVVTAGPVARVGVVVRRPRVVPVVGVPAAPAVQVVRPVPVDPMVTVAPRVSGPPVLVVPAVAAPVCGHVGDDTPQG